MKPVAASFVVVAFAAVALQLKSEEKRFDFRRRYQTVHEADLRNPSSRCGSDEFEFRDGCKVPDADFADFLSVSMNVKASQGQSDAFVVSFDETLRNRECVIEVGDGVKITAKDAKAAKQACCHLEDLMCLRRGPYLRRGIERRRGLFAPRMTHSGWGLDQFPDGYLERLVHHGFDSIVFYVSQWEGSYAERIRDLIRRATAHGLDSYLYSTVNKRAFVHPDDPRAEEIFAGTYGRIASAYRGAKGIVFVGESSEFPSKDERTCGLGIDYSKEARPAGDRRPFPGFFPCRDYPDWLAAVRRALHAENPGLETVFWTYNWGNHPIEPRQELIARLPKDVPLLVTFEMFESYPVTPDLEGKVDDYSIAFEGPGKYFISEAEAAKRHGLTLLAMANTAGRTWDLGMAPYVPVPYQWKRRWDALRAAQTKWGLAGLMESHHFGWTPSFVSELAKEAFIEGGLDFDWHLRAIAARDFGESNVPAALGVWMSWSEAIRLAIPHVVNQYGPFRYGPAYPFTAGAPDIAPADMSEPPMFVHPTYRSRAYRKENAPAVLRRECELLDAVVAVFMNGARAFYAMAAGAEPRTVAKANEMGRLGEYFARSYMTTANVKRAFDAERRGDRESIMRIATAEYDNVQAALELSRRDSTLGYEPRMGYRGDVPALTAKLRWMEKHYRLK